MPKTNPPYPLEFRQQLIELVHAGRSPEKLAKEFELFLAVDQEPGRAGCH